MSIFGILEPSYTDEVHRLLDACEKDPFDKKVNLTFGTYRNDEGKPWILPVVRKVEAQMTADLTLNKDYLPISGSDQFCQNAMNVILGEGNPLLVSRRADSVQTIGCTGALYLAYLFMSLIMGRKSILLSKPTWSNHIDMAIFARFETFKEYRYLDEETLSLDFKGMILDIESAPEKSVILLQPCAHNPTGMDLSKEQWIKLAEVLKAKSIFPIFDITYQGLASGDLDIDAWPVRYFAEQGFEMIVCQSFSKNFGLYNERVGNTCIITKSADLTSRAKSQLKILARRTWSNPPDHGSRIVATVLSNKVLNAEWKMCVKTMFDRIVLMRRSLYQKLQELGTPGKWDFIVKQKGMFAYTKLTRSQVDYMREKYHIYMLSCGLFAICGLNTSNVDYVAKAIDDAVRNA